MKLFRENPRNIKTIKFNHLPHCTQGWNNPPIPHAVGNKRIIQSSKHWPKTIVNYRGQYFECSYFVLFFAAQTLYLFFWSPITNTVLNFFLFFCIYSSSIHRKQMILRAILSISSQHSIFYMNINIKSNQFEKKFTPETSIRFHVLVQECLDRDPVARLTIFTSFVF